MSKSASLPNLEYLKYIEPHLSTKILEFILKIDQNEELKSLYKTLTIKTRNFTKINSEKFLSESDSTSLKSKTDEEIKNYEEQLRGYLNLAENCEKQKTYDLNFFSLGKKIIEQTPPKDIIQFSNILFDTNDYSKASMILNSFSIFHENNIKTKSKAIFALYLLYSLRIYSQEKVEEIPKIFSKIVKGIDQLKNFFDDRFKQTDFDAVDREQIDFREILLYRGYLLHWALFLVKYDMTLFLDTLFDDKYFSLIESSFIYLIKYLIVFAIINGNRKFIYKLKDSISKKRNFISNNRDCFILLLEDILIYFNSKNAKTNIENCKNLMKNDYFMQDYIDIFDKKVKELMVENYLILNESIDIEEIKFILDEEKDENTKKILIEKIEYLYPNAAIKEEQCQFIMSLYTPSKAYKQYLLLKTEQQKLYCDIAMLLYTSERISKHSVNDLLKDFAIDTPNAFCDGLKEAAKLENFWKNYFVSMANDMFHPTFGMRASLPKIRKALKIDGIITHQKKSAIIHFW